ncbi:MAG TPA: GNAT family N-acetyltransferase [Paraburkholderia sp.]|nr:GNAT family N-acetyltransferase [Paraburkholderia sp.]
MSTVLAVAPTDFKRWADHLDRLFADSGKNGQPLFSPFERLPDSASPERRQQFVQSLGTAVRQPGWMRAWHVEDAAGRMVAHLDLCGLKIPAENHRMTLGIGCEPAVRRRGIGAALMQHAIAFATDHGIEWIDLFVFDDNAAAIALYERFGFVEAGRRQDRFRLMGKSVDDVTMTLRVPRTI